MRLFFMTCSTINRYLCWVMLHKSKWFGLFVLAGNTFFNHANGQSMVGAFGIDAGIGTQRNINNYSDKTAGMFLCRALARTPAWKGRVAATGGMGLEYAAMQIDQNSVGKNLQPVRGIFGVPQVALEFTGNPLAKNQFIEFGAGMAWRRKLHESSYWQLSGNKPLEQFAGKSTLFPFHFAWIAAKPKSYMAYRLDLGLERYANSWQLNTISFTVGMHWYTNEQKTYYKGTHRTLQNDDVWNPQD